MLMSMDSTYRPQSPDLSSYVPQSPDLSGLRPQSPDLSGLISPPPNFAAFSPHQHHQSRFGGAFSSNGFGGPTSYMPTSTPQQASYDPQQYQPGMASASRVKGEVDNDEYMPDAPPAKRSRGRPPKHSLRPLASNGDPYTQQPAQSHGQASDPTLGVHLKTSFPVARIKRIMQADEDIGKVAQVTPHVVSRALELFMIKLISASAVQARGGAQGGGGAAKGPKRILAQHMKRAIESDQTFDFLAEIAEKVADAPSKAKKDVGSDSEENPKPRKKGKKRKDSGDDL